ncbi:phospholipid methyltransferase [Aureococcus anophagefferens]|nr:phospholipid methyltransferase [Aureococcus anophagefferens]
MMMLRAAALALLAEAKVVRETLYRITPRNYTGVTDLDTGDAAGDAHFGLYEKSAPVVCDAKLNPRHAENILCENDALLQIPGFNVYIAVEVEMDDRYGAGRARETMQKRETLMPPQDYAECNPAKSLPHAFNCTHWHHDGPEGCWNKNDKSASPASIRHPRVSLRRRRDVERRPRIPPKFGKPLPPAGYPEICYADFYPIEGYRNNKTAFKTLDNVSLADCCAACAAAEHGWERCGSYSFTAADAGDGYGGSGTCAIHGHTDSRDLVPDRASASGWFSGDGLANFVESASMTLSDMMNGTWFSTQKAGECAPGETVGEGCFWRVVNQTAQVNATCVNDRMISKIVAQRGGACFDGCDDPKDQSAPCWIQCFFETIVGNATAQPPLPPTDRALILDAFEGAFAPGAGARPCPTARTLFTRTMAVSFAAVEPKFAAYHLSSMNVNFHLLTSLLGLLGAAGLVTKLACAASTSLGCGGRQSLARGGAFGLWVLWGLALLCSDVPLGLAARSAAALASVAIVACRLDLGVAASLGCVAAGYALQDLSHWYYGEETLQANSWAGGGLSAAAVVELFCEHVFYLLPLILASASEAAKTVVAALPAVVLAWGNVCIDSDSVLGLPWTAKKSRLLVGKFRTEEDVGDLAAIRRWCVAAGPKHDMTSHWWAGDLDEPTRAFERLVAPECVDGLFRQKFGEGAYVIEPVSGMNELYVSAPVKRDEAAKTSDDVFFTEHVDGPYCFFPFASVFRCIVALDANVPGYETHFPNAHRSVAAEHGDILAFDFHRESHYITMKPRGAFGPESEAALAADPTQKWRMVLKLHYAVAPTGLWWCFGKGLHWLSTKYNEAFRALFLATIKPQSALEKLLADVGVNGTTVAYNALEKYVGFSNLASYGTLAAVAYAVESYALFLYGTQFLPGQEKSDSTSLQPLVPPESLVLVAAGYFVSIAATSALGVDGTYFGIELGVVEADYKFVRNAHPYLVPIHVALYLAHLTQEAWDYHDGVPWFKQGKKEKKQEKKRGKKATKAA